jgi:hypothetical protein
MTTRSSPGDDVLREAGARRRLSVLNGDAARFECVYPTCGGACCKESRPPVDPGEAARIEAHLAKFVPLMRDRARRLVETKGFRTKRSKEGRPMLAIVDRYCVFYNEGCVLHKVGASEGDKNRYKPGTCITFPMDATDDGRWYVRQWGTEGEAWDLACLDPKASDKVAEASLSEEIAFIERVEAGEEAWRD